MKAFIYGLNDSDERVRAKAADEIGDQIRRNRCYCGSPVVCALTHALADCDRSVRRQAEEALQLCGYKIVDGCCQPCGNTAMYMSGNEVWSGQQSHMEMSTNTGNAAAANSESDWQPTDRTDPAPVPPTSEADHPELPSPSAPVESSTPLQPVQPEVVPEPVPNAAPLPADGSSASFPVRFRDLKLRKVSGLSNLLGLERRAAK